jgi:hypothetical protein
MLLAQDLSSLKPPEFTRGPSVPNHYVYVFLPHWTLLPKQISTISVLNYKMAIMLSKGLNLA